MNRGWSRDPFGNLAFGAGIAAAVACAYLATPTVPRLDDPYIYLHSADVLRTGVDRAYPGVAPLVGITSPVFLLLVTLLRASGVHEMASLRVLGAGAIVTVLIAAWRLLWVVGPR